MLIIINLPTLEDTQRLGCLLGKHLAAGSVLLLTGDLGTGKTSLVQGIGRGLGIIESIVSPTFTLINEYLEGRVPLYHLDLYRLEPNQVSDIYPEIYWEGIEVDPGITAIEWSQRLTIKPPSYLAIELVSTLHGSRQARLNSCGRNTYDLKFIEKFSTIAQ